MIQHALADRRQARHGDGRDAAVDVGAAEVDRDGGVLVAGAGRGRRDRRIVDVGDRQCDGGRAGQRAVRDRVREAVRAEVARRRRVGEAAVRGNRHAAALGRREGADARCVDDNRVAVDVAIDACARVVAQHVAGDGRVLVRRVGVGKRGRCVVGARDHDRQRRRRRRTVGVGDLVGEDVVDRLTCAERLHVRVGVVERIGVAAVGLQRQRAVAAGHRRSHAARRHARPGHDACHGRRDRVGADQVVGRHDVAGSRERGVLRNRCDIVARHRRIVADGDRERARPAVAERVGDRHGNIVGYVAGGMVGAARERVSVADLAAQGVEAVDLDDTVGRGNRDRRRAAVRKVGSENLRSAHSDVVDGMARVGEEGARECLAGPGRSGAAGKIRFQHRAIGVCDRAVAQTEHRGRTPDRDRQRRGVGVAIAVGDLVGEGIGDRGI